MITLCAFFNSTRCHDPCAAYQASIYWGLILLPGLETYYNTSKNPTTDSDILVIRRLFKLVLHHPSTPSGVASTSERVTRSLHVQLLCKSQVSLASKHFANKYSESLDRVIFLYHHYCCMTVVKQSLLLRKSRRLPLPKRLDRTQWQQTTSPRNEDSAFKASWESELEKAEPRISETNCKSKNPKTTSSSHKQQPKEHAYAESKRPRGSTQDLLKGGPQTSPLIK